MSTGLPSTPPHDVKPPRLDVVNRTRMGHRCSPQTSSAGPSYTATSRSVGVAPRPAVDGRGAERANRCTKTTGGTQMVRGTAVISPYWLLLDVTTGGPERAARWTYWYALVPHIVMVPGFESQGAHASDQGRYPCERVFERRNPVWRPTKIVGCRVGSPRAISTLCLVESETSTLGGTKSTENRSAGRSSPENGANSSFACRGGPRRRV